MTTDKILLALETGYNEDLEVPDSFTIVEEGEWVQEYKDQTCEIYVKHEESGRHFCIRLNRRGSYWSDYDYSDPNFFEVERLEETKVVVTWKFVQ